MWQPSWVRRAKGYAPARHFRFAFSCDRSLSSVSQTPVRSGGHDGAKGFHLAKVCHGCRQPRRFLGCATAYLGIAALITSRVIEALPSNAQIYYHSDAHTAERSVPHLWFN